MRETSKHRLQIPALGRHRGEGNGLPGEAQLVGNHLLTNSLFLMLNTVAMAVLGLVTWVVAARIYSPEQIGAGTTLVSASGLLGLASLLGFNNSLVRFLPTSKRRNAHINTGLLLVFSASVILATAYVLIIPVSAPKLLFVHDSPLMFLGFVLFTAGTSLNILTDSIFIAYRAAKFNLLIDGGLQSVSKIVLIVVMQGLGAYGVFASAGAAAALAVLGSVVILVRLFEYRPKASFDREALRQVAAFAGGNYFVSLLSLSPVLLLPLIVVDRLGTAEAGYFYIAFMIANVVFSGAYSISQSVFAEASYEDQHIGELVRRGARLMVRLVVPAGLALAVGSRLLMLPFGHAYSEHAAGMLTVLGLSAPFVAVADLCGAVMRARELIKPYIILNAVFAAGVVALSFIWASHGLTGIGWAWFAGSGIAAVVGSLMLLHEQLRALARAVWGAVNRFLVLTGFRGVRNQGRHAVVEPAVQPRHRALPEPLAAKPSVQLSKLSRSDSSAAT